MANTEAQGIRDIDPSGIYLTLFRNAVINLAKKVREGSTWTHRAGEKSDAVVSQNGIAWNGAQPGGGGGGGSGSLSTTASGAGGQGAAGQVIIIEYF